jgi:hypothetical protein
MGDHPLHKRAKRLSDRATSTQLEDKAWQLESNIVAGLGSDLKVFNMKSESATLGGRLNRRDWNSP